MTPKTTQADVEAMINLLSEFDWAKAHRLWSLGNARKLRAIASNSKGAIISGNEGYKLTSKASSDEIRHCVNRLRSQADEMRKRANDIMNFLAKREAEEFITECDLIYAGLNPRNNA